MQKIFLSDYEKRMLDGEFGRLKQRALELIVKYAKVLNAKKLCLVSKAHLSVGAHHYMEVVSSDDIDEVISQLFLCTSEKLFLDKVACYSQTDSCPLDPDKWQHIGVSKDQFEKDGKYRKRYLEAGVHLVGSCIPYMVGFIPLMGEHYVSTESHAILLMNSIWGACANADCAELSLCSAICGRTPYWGNHIMKNRKGTHIINVQFSPNSIEDWDILGFAIGKKLPSNSIPIIKGIFPRPDILDLKSFFASMATSGGPEMCHILGITPEAQTIEQALGCALSKNVNVIEVKQKDINESFVQLSDKGREKIDFISLGCPHYAISQLKKVSELLKGKKIHKSVELQIWTAIPIKKISDVCGYTKIIEDSGAILLTSSCPLLAQTYPTVNAMAFDSCKQAQYIRSEVKSKVFFDSMEKCIESAISGYWEGGKR